MSLTNLRGSCKSFSDPLLSEHSFFTNAFQIWAMAKLDRCVLRSKALFILAALLTGSHYSYLGDRDTDGHRNALAGLDSINY